MSGVRLMLLLSVVGFRRVFAVPSCPASCLVCSHTTVVCHRLGRIIDAPDTTQALLLTEGSISTVQSASLSDLRNVTLIGLSHNRIWDLGDGSFRRLPLLHTLLLDHNLLSGRALQGGALSHLIQLQVLHLGHNLLETLRGVWLEGSRSLRSLKLEGNRLSRLDGGSFPPDHLRALEILDLSDNLIVGLDGSSFRGLVALRTLDLSRNRLSSAAPDAFTYLSWLNTLNLDLNSWNCTCQLLELATFLSDFIQQPDKMLYNGRRMVCVSADNPSVSTVLELTRANCVPSNQNITVRVDSRHAVTPQRYARDVAVAAVVCFTGGAGLALAAALVCYRASRRTSDKPPEKAEGGVTPGGHVGDQDGWRRRRAELRLHAAPWDGRPRRAAADGHFGRFNGMRNGGMEEEERERWRWRVMMEEGRKPGNQAEASGRFLSHAGETADVYGARVERRVAFECEGCLRKYESLMKKKKKRRNVRFDLGISERRREDGRAELRRSSRDEEGRRRARSRVKMSSKHLRKNKIHPRRRDQEGNQERSRSRSEKVQQGEGVKGSSERARKEEASGGGDGEDTGATGGDGGNSRPISCRRTSEDQSHGSRAEVEPVIGPQGGGTLSPASLAGSATLLASMPANPGVTSPDVAAEGLIISSLRSSFPFVGGDLQPEAGPPQTSSHAHGVQVLQADVPQAAENLPNNNSMTEAGLGAGAAPRRKLTLVLPEKTSSRPPSALERKIR